MTTDTATVLRSHNDTDAAAAAVRRAERLARAERNAQRRADNDADTFRGYGLFPVGLTVAGTTGYGSPVLASVVRSAETVARSYVGTDAGTVVTETVDRFARVLTRCDLATYVDYVTSRRRAFSSARTIAVRVVTDTARGTGSMPRLNVPASVVDDYVTRVARLALTASDTATAAYTVAVATGVGHTIGRGHVSGVCPACQTFYVPARTFRPMTETERNAVIRELKRFRRVEATPSYSYWLNGLGQTVPAASVGHEYAHDPIGVPERDADGLWRGTFLERCETVARHDTTTDAIDLALSAVSETDANGRYRKTVPWQDIAAVIGVNADTLRRRVTVAVDRASTAYAVGSVSPVGNGLTVVATGRTSPVGTSGPTYAVGYTWSRRPAYAVGDTVRGYGRTVLGPMPHLSTCVRDGRTVTRCDTACRALWQTRTRRPVYGDADLAAVTVAVRRSRGNGLAAVPCREHDAGTCPVACPVRVARRGRLARVARVTTRDDYLAAVTG